MQKLASIDVGTNTVRLLIIQSRGNGSYSQIYQEQEIARLGEGFNQHRKLQPQAMQRTLAALERFARRSAEYGADRIYAMATSAVRESANGEEFARMVRERTGFELNIISPDKEAELALKGITSVFDPHGQPFLAMDIGGGSTEFILADPNGKPVKWTSLDLGVVKLKELFLKHDPPEPADYAAMCEHIRRKLSEVDFVPSPAPVLVGTAGTVTTLAAVDQRLYVYDPRKINNYRLLQERVSALQDTFMAQSLQERRNTPGLEPGRADVIIGGTAAVLEVMRKFNYPSLLACDTGLREGIILDMLEK